MTIFIPLNIRELFTHDKEAKLVLPKTSLKCYSCSKEICKTKAFLEYAGYRSHLNRKCLEKLRKDKLNKINFMKEPK
jgi:hypothetical protein